MDPNDTVPPDTLAPPTIPAPPPSMEDEEALAERGVDLLFALAARHPAGFAVGNLDVVDVDRFASEALDE